jgi:hypothetical protein
LQRAKAGGAEGSRTPDLLIANEALYQLSYDPSRRLQEIIRFARNCKDCFGKDGEPGGSFGRKQKSTTEGHGWTQIFNDEFRMTNANYLTTFHSPFVICHFPAFIRGRTAFWDQRDFAWQIWTATLGTKKLRPALFYQGRALESAVTPQQQPSR